MLPSSRPAPPGQTGFSLVEQVVCLAIAAILVALAVPVMAHLVTRTATAATADQLFAAAKLARTSAIMHNADVLLCPSLDGHHCRDAADWNAGWIVALDRDHDRQPDAGALAQGAVDIDKALVVGSTGRRFVRFRPTGGAAGTNITLVVCPAHAGDLDATAVVISNSGRIRRAKASKAQRSRCPATG